LNTNFEGASLVGARIGCCHGDSFRGCALTGGDLQDAEITACDFSRAKLDGIKMDGASYDPANPPRGLSEKLLSACRHEPADAIPREAGLEEFPVAIRGSLSLVEIS
jgi:uncharacterized protein YjbI with pentapeptide repeats